MKCGICSELFVDCNDIVPDHIRSKGMGSSRRDAILTIYSGRTSEMQSREGFESSSGIGSEKLQSQSLLGSCLAVALYYVGSWTHLAVIASQRGYLQLSGKDLKTVPGDMTVGTQVRTYPSSKACGNSNLQRTWSVCQNWSNLYS